MSVQSRRCTVQRLAIRALLGDVPERHRLPAVRRSGSPPTLLLPLLYDLLLHRTGEALADESERASDLGGAEGIRTPGLLVANSGQHSHSRLFQALLRSWLVYRGRSRLLRLLHFTAAPTEREILALFDTHVSSGSVTARGLRGWAGFELLRHFHVQISVNPSDLSASGLNHTDRLDGGGDSCLAARVGRVRIIGLRQGEFFDSAGQLGVAVGPGEEGISKALLGGRARPPR
ncbi:hypothetical protein EV644_105311 [Kribbella orskensis]|uniref:Uncharacterized protein n=1 Tax=Kribbella orskensis TaxID=2512216 RepID=A0ABY2BMD3_9ACTN|nr:hypothetical protein EV642_104311 [Kribbella sp. VKM Ac-2500]TCO24277.1 hypothetical protein EV644_105311 [Kribbella orskensis]